MSTNTPTEPAADLTESTHPQAVHTLTIRCRGQFPIPQPAVRTVEVVEAPMTTFEAKRKSREEFRARRKAYMHEYHKHYDRPRDRRARARRAEQAKKEAEQ